MTVVEPAATSDAGPAKAPTTRKAVASKSVTKKAPAKKSAAKKVPAKRPATKKPAASKPAAKRTPVKAATVRKAPVKKASPRTKPAIKNVPAVSPVPVAEPPAEFVAPSSLAVQSPLPVVHQAPTVLEDGRPQKSLEQFVAHVLGSAPGLTSQEVAAQAGVSEDVARGLWRAMGFADMGGEAQFAAADVEAIRALMSLVDAGYISFDESIEMVRAIGQHTSRLAEWQGNIIARSLIERGVLAKQGVLQPEDIGPLLRDSQAYKPVLETLMVYSWRRQMTHNASRAAALADAGPDARAGEMSVGFADLAGFTRLSRQIPEEDLAILVKQFESVSADVVASHGSRLIKTLGDEVLFAHESPKKVAKIALELHEAHRESSDVPRMRIGLGTGPVLLRMGDVFGTTVNRASRLTAMAKPGSTFVDAATFEALMDAKQLSFKSVRPRPARGFGLSPAWWLRRAKTK